ncbi:phosphatase PAP2 family protein [Nocardia sp. NBC_01388]|uniref:phosphatase PAP2 family protein n=1 Tax=Nocardia sp. NBC_01388 TaxID=2903596 RepID=UPI00324B8DEA
MTLDTRIFLRINEFARETPWLHPIVSDYIGIAAAVSAGLIVAGWWIARGRRDATAMAAAVWTPIAVIVAFRINQPLAAMAGKARPYVTHSSILVLSHHSGPSFPSHRAVEAGAVTAGLLLVHRSLAIVAACAALALAFADVYIGAHYPQDEVAGLVFGIAACLIGFDLTRHPLRWAATRLRRTRLWPLVSDAPTTAAADR